MVKEIQYSGAAYQSLRKMSKNVAAKIVSKIDLLSVNPGTLKNNIKKLQGIESLYRLRVGDYRVFIPKV